MSLALLSEPYLPGFMNYVSLLVAHGVPLCNMAERECQAYTFRFAKRAGQIPLGRFGGDLLIHDKALPVPNEYARYFGA